MSEPINVKIKPLAWTDADGKFEARTVLGTYYVERQTDGAWTWTGPGWVPNRVNGGPADGKAAAQAAYFKAIGVVG